VTYFLEGVDQQAILAISVNCWSWSPFDPHEKE
jgi:hypothetical protein